MHGGNPPPKLSLKMTENTEQIISPPPFGLTGAGAAAITDSTTENIPTSAPELQVPSGQSESVVFSPASISTDAILNPKPGCDVGALIFVLLTLPQSVSCLVLTSYILLGSFKSLAGRFIAKYFLKSEDRISFNLETSSRARNSYYRSELLGEFLQLFSVNSFILLICHFSLPRAWFQYLIVLAKSIIASRLVGTHTTGSTTYVSVVSNSANNNGCVTTTTTSNNGNAYTSGTTRTETKNSPGGFANFVTGFSFVVAANYIKERMSNMNTSILWGDISRLCSTFLWPKSDFSHYATHDYPEANSVLSSPMPSINFLSSRKSTYYEDTKVFSAKASWASRLVFKIFIKYCRLGDKSIERLSFISREFFIVINFAYLVLCIHVISLTISPYLKRIFILKDYSKTLDHLSCLTPDVPYGGFKKGGIISSLPRNSSSESVVVINMEQPRTQSSATSEPYEIKLNSKVASNPLEAPLRDSKEAITAENFKIFCMKPPATKTPVSGFKQSQNRTIVDRKRSNSTAIPSTTIMDRYFTVSTQPIWTWIAAIKVLAVKPHLFSGPPAKSSLETTCLESPTPMSLHLALVSAESSRIVFELMDLAVVSNLSFRVNGIPWNLVDVSVSKIPSSDKDKAYISIYGLFPLYQFEVEIFGDEVLVGCFIVSTAAHEYEQYKPNDTNISSVIGLLQSSLRFSIASINEMKTNFKKTKKEESKRVTELKRQIDSLKSKIDKYGTAQTNEGRIGGKLKGLQNSVMQLENEIRELERQINDIEKSNHVFEEKYDKEERSLKLEIVELESYILESEQKLNQLRMDVRAVEGEKEGAEARLKKTEGKLRFRKDEIAKLNGEIKGFKKTLTAKIQKRQKKIHDRLGSIIPKIMEASDELSLELKGYFNDNIALE